MQYRYLNIGEKINKTDEVDVTVGYGTPKWERVVCMIGWKVTEGTYAKYRRPVDEVGQDIPVKQNNKSRLT
jgi:hypothetical protein